MSLYTFLESLKGNRALTLINAVAAIDNSTGTTSAAFDLAALGFSNMILEFNLTASGTTDDLIWELFASFDGTNFSDVVTRTGTLANAGASAKRHMVDISGFPWTQFKLKLLSAGASDTYTATVKMRRYLLSESQPRE